MSEENKVIETEKEENTQSENKENEPKKGFKAWFNKTKGDVNNYLLENKIENAFNKANEEFSLGTYSADSILPNQKQVFGYFDNDGKLVLFGEKEIQSYSIVVSNKTNEAYTVMSKDSNCPIEIELEGTKYIRNGTKFNLGDKPKEIKTIKVMGKTYLYEGN